MHIAAALCGPQMVSMLLERMADVNVKSRFDATPLHFAAQQGHARVVTLLLEARAADLDAPRRFDDPRHDGATPIYLASEGNRLKVVEMLIKAGARAVNIRKNNGIADGEHTFDFSMENEN